MTKFAYFRYLEDSEDVKGSGDPNLIKEVEESSGHKKFVKVNDTSKIKIRFSDLPISKYTSKGLFQAKYVRMTEVQRCSVPHALNNRNLLICSRTGSGKTLSYCIPVVEKLYRQKWTQLDGLGAIIICPVRELAIQTFEVLRSFASMHDMSAGLIIGGKQVDIEKTRIASMNILVCTPGRLLQHMDETPDFVCDNLQTLVLDEVDRCLDLGFQDQIQQIMQNVPITRVQTLLYSATAKKSIEKLAKKFTHSHMNYFNLNHYEGQADNMAQGEAQPGEESKDADGNYVPKYITPVKLTHYFMKIDAENKLDTLFSFIKSHKTLKCVVFFSSCKQVRHAYESFNKLKTGVTLMEIHGRQKQMKRTAIYFEFVERKNAYLFATDIASRGMDFPAVDWVFQVDLPEDTDTYIHRVGRTARYKFKGSAILLTLPSEAKFVEKLKAMNIDMKSLKANPNRTMSITSALQRMNASNPELMHLAQKAFVCYIKSVFKNSDKEIFDISKINHEALGASMGLVTTPVIEMVKNEEDGVSGKKKSKLQKLREKIKQKKQKVVEIEAEGDADSEAEGDASSQKDESSQNDVELPPQEESDDEELFQIKRKIEPDQPLEEGESEDSEDHIPVTKFSKNKLKKIKRGGIADGKNKVYFDKTGKTITSLEYHMKHGTFKGESADVAEAANPDDAEEATSKDQSSYITKVKESLLQNKGRDDQIATDRVKQKRIKKRKQKEEYRKQLEKQSKNEYYMVEGEGDQSEGE